VAGAHVAVGIHLEVFGDTTESRTVVGRKKFSTNGVGDSESVVSNDGLAAEQTSVVVPVVDEGIVEAKTAVADLCEEVLCLSASGEGGDGEKD
jgi:hypothetical protein